MKAKQKSVPKLLIKRKGIKTDALIKLRGNFDITDDYKEFQNLDLKRLGSHNKNISSILEFARLSREKEKIYVTQDELRKMINEGRE